MNGTIAYALSRKYVDKTADRLGSLKGAPCTVKNVTNLDSETTVIFEWEGASGEKETTQFTISDGDSAYEIAKKNGFVGTEEEWLASLKGETGDTEQIETIVEEKVQEQIETQLDDTIQEKVDKAIEDALGGGSGDSSEIEDEIDSWF